MNPYLRLLDDPEVLDRHEHVAECNRGVAIPYGQPNPGRWQLPAEVADAMSVVDELRRRRSAGRG